MFARNRELDKVRSKVITMVKRKEVPSLAIAVVNGGELVWEEAFGFANQEENIEASPHTIYPIASLSKSLTATAIMVLAERKQLSLDAPVEEYIAPLKLTAYQGQAQEVTVRRVLNMTSGIPHGYKVCGSQNEAPSLQEFVGRYGMTVFPPGEAEIYSNFSYAVLELIIENVSGKSFAEFMETEVFLPLGMMDSSVGVPQNPGKNIAVKYGSDNKYIPHNYFVPAAAGGMYSSAHDLIAYGILNLNNHAPHQRQILRSETLTTMHMDKDTNLPSANMSLGWASVELDKGLTWLISNGGIEGATSMLTLVPSANLAVVCLTNITSRSRITDQIAMEITTALVPNFAEKANRFMKHFESADASKPYKPGSQLVGSWEGEIKAQEGGIPIKMIFRDNGKVSVRFGKRHVTLLGNVIARNGELKGDFQGVFPNKSGSTREHTISIHAKVRNGTMFGVATAEFGTNQRFQMLPFYICLNKV